MIQKNEIKKDHVIVNFPKGGHISFSNQCTLQQVKKFLGPQYRLKYIMSRKTK